MAQISIETVNDNISMIDFELSGIKRLGALYLIKGDEKSCLIDSGTKDDSTVISHAAVLMSEQALTKCGRIMFKT